MKKLIRKLKKLIFSRVIIISVSLIMQILMFLVFIVRLSRYFAAMYGVFVVISALVALHIVSDDSNPAYKLAWIIPVLIFPLFGGMLYLFFGSDKLGQKIERRISDEERVFGLCGISSSEKTAQLPPRLRIQSEYISRVGYPAYCGTGAEFLESGERKFEEMKKAIASAKQYIFLEYFIIGEGYMWDSIHELLKEKAAQGVDVRVIYDGFGCIATLPNDYFLQLNKEGIRCVEFNPLIPIFTMFMNHRDHRKILVVDGVVGFMGGVNIADEYINRINRFGHWKDTAVRLEGDAVYSLTAMFVTMWNAVSLPRDRCEPSRFAPIPVSDGNGVVQPYSDTPLDRERVGETVYLNMINRAERYIYICTPYLITDNETVTSLINAAKSGIDVRIITPHHGDKWYVHAITRHSYEQLLKGNVRIYEYTPGFIHAKLFVTDDNAATVGTVNLDFRSLYLHFECGVWFGGGDIPVRIREDFEKTLQKCIEITTDSPIVRKRGLRKLGCQVLKLFAPLM